MTAALNDMEKIFYEKPYVEYLTELNKIGKASSVEPTVTNTVARYVDTEYGRAQFPTGFDSLDRLIKNETCLDIFAQCLGTDDASYCNAHLFMRSGPTDQPHSEHSWQGYHGTNTCLPISSAVGSFDYVNSGVYLHDGDNDCTPMHVIPGSHRQAAEILLRMSGGILDRRKVPEFAQPVPTSAKTGSVLFYSSYLIHAAIPF